MFDVVFLIIWILVVLALVLYLFYWNRVVGFFLSLLVRFLSWNQASASTWIDIGSIQFSLLAGRILFKDLRYHTSNQTIRLVKGQIAWRYWIRKPTEEDDLRHARVGAEDVGRKAAWPLACRVHLSVQGAEWFIYNRTAAYDDIISQMSGEPLHRSYTAETQQSTAPPKEPDYEYPPETPAGSASVLTGAPSIFKKILEWVRSQLPRIEFKDLLPISMEVEKGTIICGNSSTPNLLVAEYKKAEGTYGVVPSRSPCDLYKQLLSVKFRDPSIHYVVNPNYASSMTSTGEKLHNRIHKSQAARRHLASYLQYGTFLKLWRRLPLGTILNSLSRPPHTRSPDQPHVSGFRRRKTNISAEEETPVGADFSVLEYAIERKILEAPVLELSYYADVVGVVPHQGSDAAPNPSDPFDIGNGDLPPEWGIDLVIRNGVLRYGPWADRQRAELQRTFFPPVYQNSSPTPRLRPGDTRVWPSLKVFVELRDTTTLQIPFREASKDWQWDGQVEYRRSRKREAASLFLKAGENSTINYVLPMVVGSDGYEPVLEVILDTVTLTSSMDDYQLLSAESCSIRSTMPSPAKWNDQRQWDFHIRLRKSVMYLIREHINMFTDLGKDWSAGPPSDYYRFVPMVYVVDFELRVFELNLYVNDHNIIDKPSIREENGLLTIRGASLKTSVEIDSTAFRPISSLVPFSFIAPDLSISLTLPRWNTHSMNLRPEVGRIGELNVTGSYRYFSDVRPDNVDKLWLNIDAKNVVLKTFGWVIRHFMVLRDNYFGSFTQFCTLFEYIQKKDRGLPISDPTELKYRPGKANLFEVVLEVNADHNLFVLPAGLPGFDTPPEFQNLNATSPGLGPSLVLSASKIQVHLRTHDYIMEMSLNTEPISGSIVDDFPDISLNPNPRSRLGRESLFIDGIDIVANRLFGPQPKTSTYLCIWEIHVGRIKSCFSTSQVNVALAAFKSFDSGFDDVLDAPAKEVSLPLDPDATVLKVSFDGLDLVWKAGGAALHFCAPKGVRIDFNDLAGKTYKKVNSIRLCQGILKLLLASGPNQSSWLEAAHAEVDCCIDLYRAPKGWQEAAQSQAKFIVEQDAPTGRAKRLIALHGWTEKLILEPAVGYRAREFQYTEILLPMVRDPDTVRAGHDPCADQEERSESENDEHISPAVRDARLAKSRPVTPLTSPLEEYFSESSMASGDESDDEDLTEPDDCDSDTEADVDRQVVLLISRYRKCARLYWRNTHKEPSLWDDTAYQMFKDRTPLVEPSTTIYPNLPGNGGGGFATSHGRSAGAEETIIRVRVEHGIRVSISPLAVHAAALLLQDMVVNRPSPELYLDAAIQGYVSSFSDKDAPEEPSAIVLDIHLPSVQVSYLYIIPTAKLEGRSHAYMNMILLSLNGFRFSGSISPVPGFSAAIDGASVSVLSAPRPTSTQSRALLRRVSGLDLRTCRISTRTGVLACHISSLTSTFSQHSPFHVATVSASLASCIKKIHSQHTRWHSQSSSIARQTIKHILQIHQGHDVLDPLSAHRPAYLVHRGKPSRLRLDSSFRFLFRLRHLLGQLNTAQRKEIDTFAPNVTIHLDDLFALLSDASVGGPLAEPDTSDSRDVGVLQVLLPDLLPPAANAGSNDNAPIQSFVFSLDHLSIDVWDSANRNRNEVVLKSLVISCGKQSSTLIQPSLSKSPTMKDRQQRNALRRVVASIAVGDCTVTIFPHALDFVQQVLSAAHAHRPPSAAPPGSPTMSIESPPRQDRAATSIDVVFNLRRSSLRAATEKLIIEFRANALTLASSVLLEPSTSDTAFTGSTTSMNHSLLFSSVVLRACAAGVSEGQDQHVLASLGFEDGKSNAVFRQEQHSTLASRVALSLGALQLNVPRSAMRLYKFAEEWRADYLPGLERTMRAVVSEARRKPESPAPKKPSKPVAIHINALFPSIRVSLQVMHGTWLAWEMVDTTAFFRSSAAARLKKAYSFGIQARQQVFSISSQPHWLHGLRKRTRVKFAVPMISVQGKYDGTEVQVMVLVEFFNLIFRPSHWDTVLTVQQKFGQDFSDLISLVNEKRTVTSPKTESTPVSPRPRSPRIKLGGVVKMKGFRIGLEGPSSVLFLECQNIGGGMQENYGHSWKLSVLDLALSLAPRTHSESGIYSFDRINRTAFVSIDFHVSATQSPTSSTHTLDISVTKVHAVMQPSSIGQLGDFIDHIQAELRLRAERRVKELAAFKEKTREFIRTFESSKPVPDAIQSWISDFLINFTFKNIGIAFPLDFDHSLRVDMSESGNDLETGAFLLSIKSLSFGVQRGESGQAVMKGTALQFVSRFRQSIPSDFIEENHQTRNKLLYPEMTAQVKTDRCPDSRTLRVSADVSGFILDIDSSIPVYVFSLIDVYQRGKEHFDRMAESIESMPRSFSSFDATPRIPIATLEPHYDALPTSNVVGSLIFHSGKVRLYCDATSTYSRIRAISISGHEMGEDYSALEASADLFNLPEVSVWAEYRARSAAGKVRDLGDVSTLMFKSTIHSSSNVFKPTILPFLRELVDHVENRLNRTTLTHAKRPSGLTPRPSPSPLIRNVTVGDPSSVTSMQISFSLRIDQSKLELTCQPDANVIAGVHWESGGFVVNVSPGFKQVAFTGSVGGLSVGLKHGFLSEDCVHLNANNLSFNITLAESEYGGLQKTLSAVMDTEFTGGVRFSRLQDILCFKAVWLDRIPVFTNRSESPVPSIDENQLAVAVGSDHQHLDTAVLVRLRHVKLDVDFGQSISSTNIEFREAVLRTKVTRKIYEFSLEVANSLIVATGNISGHGSVPDFLFRTKRKRGGALRAVDTTEMLKLTMTSGPLDLIIESDHQRILQYRAEPIQVMIFDDWTMMSPIYPEIERRLRLSFTVFGKEVVLIATVETIPQLVSYANKFSANMEAQREGALRESKAFRISASPKPDNPLSDVANAMFQSARSKFKETEDVLTYIIRQQMSLRLDALRLIVFPRTMHDHEMAHFLGSNIHAKLDRVVKSGSSTPKRDLQLSFASLTISKLNQTRYSSSTPKDNETASVYILDVIRRSQEAIIFGLPSMKIKMVTDEEKGPGLKKIYYDFASEFIRMEGMADAEDIFITLNVALYSWLTILRKNFTKEMNQVQAAAERPTTTPNLVKRAMKAVDGIPDDLGIPAIAVSSETVPFPPASSPIEGLPSAPLSVSATRSFTPSQFSAPTPPLPQAGTSSSTSNGIEYIPQHTSIDKLTMRQLGEATPDVMHPFFMKKAGFNLEESLPQYVHEYATLPTEEIMKALLRLYSKQLKTKHLS